MDATDLVVGSADEIGADEDTKPLSVRERCAVCVARDDVDAAMVRAGVTRVTTVSDYTTPPSGTATVERASAMIARAGGLFRGNGASREEAMLDALIASGCEP